MATKTATKPAAETTEKAEAKGTNWLAEHVNAETGSSYDGYGIRILLRSLTKEGVIERGEGRYNFAGPRDKTVLAVVKAVKSGAADKAKAERLESLKAKKTAAKPAVEEETPAPAAKRTRTRKAAAAKPAVEEDDTDLDIDDI